MVLVIKGWKVATEEMYPKVPKPCTVLCKDNDDINPSVPKPVVVDVS